MQAVKITLLLVLYVLTDTKKHAKELSFICLYPKDIPVRRDNGVWEKIPVKCGKCIECAKEYSREWAFRCIDELKEHNGVGCIITLTYANNPFSLNKEDYQKFLKRLRKKFSALEIKYFGCGEYGSKNSRPHYHIILFGVNFDDCYYFKKSKSGYNVYRSPTLESLWPFGFSTVQEVTFAECMYCAKYLQKLQKPLKAQTPPFTFMSRRPGLGARHVDLHTLFSDKIYHNGSYIKLPRFYLNKIEKDNNIDLQWLKDNRMDKAKRFERSTEDLKKARQKQYVLKTKKVVKN